MTEDTALPGAGWKDDPEDATQLRYWDGSSWTEHRAPKGGAANAGAAQPAASKPVAQGAVAPKRSGAPWWLVAVTGVVSLLIGGAIGTGVGLMVSGGDDAVAAPVMSADETAGSDDAAAGEADDEAASDEPAPEPGSGNGAASNPLTIDTPWTYDTSWFGEDGTVWEGTFEGLVTLSVDEYDDDAGARCFAIVGTMSPTSIAGDAFTNDFFDTPSFEVVVGGAVQSDYGYCDVDALEAAGYGSLYDAEVSVGTEYKFFQEVYLPSTVTGDVDLIVVGSASDADALFYEATPASVG